MKEQDKQTRNLRETKQRVQELSAVIVAHEGTLLSREQKAKITEEEDRLTFRLSELLKESERLQRDLAHEINVRGERLKIASMENIVNLLIKK